MKDGEIRLKRGDWERINNGDWVLAFRKDGQGEFVIFEVVECRAFHSFRSALESVGFKRAVPEAKDIDEALETYRGIYGRCARLKSEEGRRVQWKFRNGKIEGVSR